MPSAEPTLTLADAASHIARSLAPTDADRVGIEIEWLVIDPESPERAVTAAETTQAAVGAPLPNGGLVTVEPGGQLELSALPGDRPEDALAATEADASELHRRVTSAGLELRAIGLDPVREVPATLDLPRYRAMTEVFATVGSSPMAMATASASVQLNIDLGAAPMDRWRRAALLGPVVLACFANSPLHRGTATGWCSTRQLLWQTLPHGRAEPVPTWSLDAWIEHVLSGNVLLIRTPDGAEPILHEFCFRDWITGGHRLGYPDLDDLDYHLTTLFPPIRPRGWIEFRMIDSVDAALRTPLIGLVTTLMRHDEVADDVAAACLPIAGSWSRAARLGCRDGALAAAARRCFRIASDVCEDVGLTDACGEFVDRYVARGRCPADDRLDGRPASW